MKFSGQALAAEAFAEGIAGRTHLWVRYVE
jgi:hypothetical protein